MQGWRERLDAKGGGKLRPLFCGQQSKAGATLVELAIVLPFLLFGVLFFIWIGVMMHAKSSLDASVTRALRLAATRGADEISGVDTIPRIHGWVAIPQTITDAQVEPLLAYNTPAGDWHSWYDQRANEVFGQNFQDLSPEYVYSVVYVNESMKQSIGTSLKYPCDPADLSEGAGCLGCWFLNPETLNPGEAYASFAPRRRIGLECRFQPATGLLRPLVAVLSMISTHTSSPLLVFKKKLFFEVPSFE